MAKRTGNEGWAVLFEKKMEPRCAYCARGTRLDEKSILCAKRGVVPAGNACRAFQYDPLKRVPPRPAPLDFDRWKEEDFTL